MKRSSTAGGPDICFRIACLSVFLEWITERRRGVRIDFRKACLSHQCYDDGGGSDRIPEARSNTSLHRKSWGGAEEHMVTRAGKSGEFSSVKLSETNPRDVKAGTCSFDSYE